MTKDLLSASWNVLATTLHVLMHQKLKTY